ncbi:MAG: hypothetical protein ACRD04_00630 [Terriglobales bacterium]
MMDFRLACFRAQSIAGMAMVGGALPQELAAECMPERPVRLLMINGTKDPLVPYKGGRSASGFRTMSVEKTAALWAKMNNCDSKPHKVKQKAQDGGKPLAITSWNGCAQASGVRLIALAGAGGAWPGGGYQPDARFGPTSHAVNASTAMGQFLQEGAAHTAERR